MKTVIIVLLAVVVLIIVGVLVTSVIIRRRRAKDKVKSESSSEEVELKDQTVDSGLPTVNVKKASMRKKTKIQTVKEARESEEKSESVSNSSEEEEESEEDDDLNVSSQNARKNVVLVSNVINTPKQQRRNDPSLLSPPLTGRNFGQNTELIE